MLRITPLSGSRWCQEGQALEPECSLVEFSGCRVLWNLGALPADPLPEHDCVILTDSTLQSVGALPLYKAGAPVYATFPTVKMGQMTLYDYHAAVSLDGGRPPFTLEELDQAMAAVQSIKYSQTMTVGSLLITAQRAGHVVGGAFYTLQRQQDETIVLLTSTYHMARELHLDSSTLIQQSSKPDVLITHPGGPAFRQCHALTRGSKPLLPPLLVSQAERALVETVMAVLRREGNVLLPADASGRVLELILVLQQHWEKQRLTETYNLVWLGPLVRNTAEFARCQLEWMASQQGQHFDLQQSHPLKLQCVHFCTSAIELQTFMEVNSNPTCVVASGLSLEHGPARDVLLLWADNPDNAIVFTDSSQCYLRNTITPPEATTPSSSDANMVVDDEAADSTSPWTVAAQLMAAWTRAKREGREMEDSVQVDVRVPQRTPLAGEELQRFLESEEQARMRAQEAAEKRAMLREVELAKGQLRLGAEEEPEIKVAVTAAARRPRKKSRFDSTLFLKFSKPLHLTFEIREDANGIGQPDSTAKYGIGESVGRSGEVLEDDYGIAVQPERFTDIVSGVDPSKFASGSGRIGDEVSRRGLGYGVDSKRGGGAAKVSEDEDNDGEEEVDEHGLEAIDLSEGNGIIRGRNGRQPLKVTVAMQKLEVLAEVSYVQLEGRVDARAARQSVRALQPRQVVVLGGPAEKDRQVPDHLVDEVGVLAEAARSFASAAKVETPSDGETVELNVGHAAYSARLIDTPYIPPDKRDEMELPDPVEVSETKLGSSMISKLDLIATGQKVALDGSLVLAPRLDDAQDAGPSLYLSDGEILLTDLRAELIAQGMKAEYRTQKGFSQLLVNGKLLVRKEQHTGKLHVEGPLCEDFYTVRGIVCRQFVVL